MKEFRENIFLTLKLKLSLGNRDFLFKKRGILLKENYFTGNFCQGVLLLPFDI